MAGATAARLDVTLAAQRSITRHAARTLIDSGCVTVNGRTGKPGQRVQPSDVVQVASPAEKPAGAGPAQPVGSTPPTLEIVYEDEWLAVVDKSAGVVVHPAAGHHGDTLADALRARGDTWSLLGGAERAGIVHRLDRDTSGLLVVARTEESHRALAQQLRTRTLGRTYWAIVRGGFREDSGTIDAPIGRHPRERKRMAVIDSGRAAITEFTVLELLGSRSLVEVRLRTGRTHQIRVHFAYIGRPIAGDPVYGQPDGDLRRPALHCRRLSFVHPVDGSTRTFESPLPHELERYLAIARRRAP